MSRLLAVAILCIGCTHRLPTNAADDATALRAATTTIAAETHAGTSDVSPETTLDALVDVGIVRLHLRCEGAGEPLVVFEAGLGLDGTAWRKVQPTVATLTRTCSYDRAGRGLSGPAPYPHGQRQMAAELYALLEESGQHAPYVLVGHSMGGAIVRWFLDAHPNDVVGMVLVDPATEDWPTKVLPRVPPEALPDFWQNLRAWEGLDANTYVAGYEALRGVTTSLASHPLVILTAEEPKSELPLRLEMHSPLKRLSSNHSHLVVEHSGHLIPSDAPAAVTDAIGAVVRAVRGDLRLSKGRD